MDEVSKKDELVNLLEVAGFVAGDENNAEAKTYNPKTPVPSLAKFYEKAVTQAKPGDSSDVINAPENPAPKAKTEKKKKLTDDKRAELAKDVVEMIAKGRIKHNGNVYKAGDKFKLDGDSAINIFLTGVAEYTDSDAEEYARKILAEVEAKDLQELAALKRVAEQHAPKE